MQPFTVTDRRQWYRNEYLNSDHWKALREQKLKQSGEACQQCFLKTRLDVHHLDYKNLFDVTLDDLICLCRECHKKEHSKIDAAKRRSKLLLEKLHEESLIFKDPIISPIQRDDNWMPFLTHLVLRKEFEDLCKFCMNFCHKKKDLTVKTPYDLIAKPVHNGMMRFAKCVYPQAPHRSRFKFFDYSNRAMRKSSGTTNKEQQT